MLTNAFLVVSLATAAFAWPIARRSDCYPGGTNTTKYTNETTTYNTFNPVSLYTYDVGTGAINCKPDEGKGKIYKSDWDNGHHITTLMTFKYPAASEGKMCQFGFSLDKTDTLTGDKGGLIDLFSSLGPAPGCTTTWGPGNQRNQHLARLAPVLGGHAKYVQKPMTYLTQPTPCKAPGTYESFELVGVYDNVNVQWDPTVSGAYITY